jgi:phytoene/squalene synthetase
MNATAALAHSITWASSKQSYLTARLLADRGLVDDCLRAYAYFRWADDLIDVSNQTNPEKQAFITRQKRLIESLYEGNQPLDLCPEEEMLSALIAHDRCPGSGLHSFILNFMRVIEFDSLRKGQTVTRVELNTYTGWLATAVMDGIQYFIGNGSSYPKTADRTLAVVGAHLVHMLRDTLDDLPSGIINIPSEDIMERNIHVEAVDSEPFRTWVRDQVEQARACLQMGKQYIDSLDNLRCKIAGTWYCCRFEWFLDAIKRDDYRLRKAYPDHQNLRAWVKMANLGLKITLKHFLGRIKHISSHLGNRVAIGPETSISSYRAK